MKEPPIESRVDEFVDVVLKDTGGTVACWICGTTEWDIYWDDAPMALGGTRIRLDSDPDEPLFGIHVVAMSCAGCGLLRFHQSRPVFPPDTP